MKDRTKLHAKYRFIPCWFNDFTNDVSGKNKMWNMLLGIVIWIDVNVVGVDEFPLWVEDSQNE